MYVVKLYVLKMYYGNKKNWKPKLYHFLGVLRQGQITVKRDTKPLFKLPVLNEPCNDL